MPFLNPGMSQYLTEPQQVMRASAALPAGGLYDATPLALECMGWTEMTLLCAYTRGALGGAVRFYLEVSYDAAPTVFYQTTCYETGAVVAGADTHSIITHEDFTWASSVATIERWEYHVEIPSNIKTIRLVASEFGVVGTPGTFAVNAMFSY